MLVPEFIVSISEVPVNCTDSVPLKRHVKSVKTRLVRITHICNVLVNRHRWNGTFFFSGFVVNGNEKNTAYGHVSYTWHRSQILYSTHLVGRPLVYLSCRVEKEQAGGVSVPVQDGEAGVDAVHVAEQGQVSLHICHAQFTCCHWGLCTIIPELEMRFCHKITYLVSG